MSMAEHLTLDAISVGCDAFSFYNRLLQEGAAREQARIHLPQGTYTEFYWKMDLHNLFGFLQKRMDHHAQSEIRVLAEKVFELIRPIVPMACEAFQDYRLDSITLSGPEIKALRDGTPLTNKREQEEFKTKRERLNI
jgi:thymidylate synthase (FAD)